MSIITRFEVGYSVSAFIGGLTEVDWFVLKDIEGVLLDRWQRLRSLTSFEVSGSNTIPEKDRESM